MFDAIVVGARCAGSPTAMLLARKGYNVLLLDRATFPSDTISLHVVKKPGVALLERWGVLEKVTTSGCPPIRTITFDVGPFALSGHAPGVVGASPEADADYAPRRTILDKILVDAAQSVGAELREKVAVESIDIMKGRAEVRGYGSDGKRFSECARIVIGADGANSLVARSVAAESYKSTPSQTCGFYTYWAGVPIDGAEIYPRAGACVVAFPTNDDLTCILVQRPAADYARFRSNLEQNYRSTIELAPSLAGRVREGRPVEATRGLVNQPNYFRKPFGPGWALVGDAGLHRDPITAQGICDAFRDSELLALALDQVFSGKISYDTALAAYRKQRDAAAGPIFDLTCQLASLSQPPAEMQALFSALRYNQAEIDRFIGTIIGTVAIPTFFTPENLARIIGTDRH